MGRRSKSQPAVSRTARNILSWSNPAVGTNDDETIGSALSLKDQFDILVPIRIPDRIRSSDESDVSSITTDEHKKMLKYIYNMRNQRPIMWTATPMGFCCCSEMNTKENTSKSTVKKKKGAGNGMVLQSVDRTCDISKSQYSLFDALSDEEDGDDERLLSAPTDDQAMYDSPIKQKRSWRKSIRKKMPWSKK
mmetsp:Transcript_3574/g.6825  ORF Transcript_3574/g.6825 Transcript_3574/m.6825 type:complete len:192 (-) Transcript_3574:737-1312(-)|eukprot:scaffold20209_cov182-Amphora_coffeaeformis.AAC.8